MEDEQSSPYLPARPIVVPPLQPSAAMPMLLARHTLARSLDTLCGCSLPTVILYTSGALLATIANSPSAHRDIFIRVFDYLEWTALRALLHAGEARRRVISKKEKKRIIRTPVCCFPTILPAVLLPGYSLPVLLCFSFSFHFI